jgi:ubiquinone biosynthesis protein
MLRSLRTLRSIPRIKDIAFILGKHGFHQAAAALQAPFRTSLRRFLKWEPRHTIQQPERLRLALEELGPTFIKFGQLLSTRPDLLPAEYIEELGKLQDEVQPAPFAEVREVLEEEFRTDATRLFRSIDPQPLASASIAQVHRAVTLAGDQVVVKVRKRGIERLIQQDLQVLSVLAEFLAGWRGIRLFDPEGVVRLFEKTIQRELNFDYERMNLARIRENMQAESWLCVPRVFPDLCRSKVLTMEYLAGEKLSSLRARPVEEKRGRQTATTIALAILKQVFADGIYHADPHPGNFILMEDGRVGLIDFGNVGRFTPDMIDDLLQLLLALIRRDYREVARWILKRGRPVGDVDGHVLALELMDTLDPYYGLSLAEIQIGGLFRALFAMVLRHGIAIPPQYVMVGRTFITLEGVVRLCSPSLELLSAIKPYMSDLLRRRWSPERILREARGEASDLLAIARALPGNLAEALARAAEGRFRLEARVAELSGVEKRLAQASSRIQLAILVCGLMVSSAILLFPDAGGERSVPAALGVAGFVAGLLLVLKLALRN